MTVPTDNGLQAQRDYAVVQLEDLARRGRRVRDRLAATPVDASSLAAAQSWQQACAMAIHQLAGGSKAHWLSRGYSAALLVRSTDGGTIVEADVATIVVRILDLLEQASRSLSQMDDVAVASSAAAPARRRFEFVHNVQLRPVLEQAFIGAGQAFEEGDYERSLRTSCGIIEAIITDALEAHARLKPSAFARLSVASARSVSEKREHAPRADSSPCEGSIAEWSFEQRIAAAEQAGLIQRGCARLPAVARTYRGGGIDGAPASADPISERDAKLARQVLHVVMRDLDPGR